MVGHFFPINDYPLGLLKQLDRVEAAGATLHELNQSSKKILEFQGLENILSR